MSAAEKEDRAGVRVCVARGVPPLPRKRGVELRIEAHGAAIVVRRCSSGRDYVASPDPHPPVQAWGPTGDRFGTAADIRRDIAHFLDIGALPAAWGGAH